MRRIKDQRILEAKLKHIDKKLKQLKIKFEKIFVISSFKYSSLKKNYKFVKANKSLKIDLKNIYKISKNYGQQSILIFT